MALTATQKVSLAAIMQETYETVDSLVSSLNFNAEQETWLGGRITVWNTKHDSIEVELEGGSKGVNLKTMRLLAKIRGEVRKMFGLSLYSEDVQQSSGAIANRFIF